MENMNITISENEKSQRLDKFLVQKFQDYSRAFLQKLINQENIKVNNRKVKQGLILKVGDVISIEIPEREGISLEPDSSIKLDILYEDENVIVINKPAGLTVHPSENQKSGTLVNGLLAKYPEIKNVGDSSTDLTSLTISEQENSGQENLRPGIIHRLDKNTSGVMIVARNNEAFQFFKKEFQERRVIKKYIALVAGDISRERGVINLPIARKRKMPTKQVAVKNVRQARGTIREAVTEYRVLRHNISIEGKKFTLVEVLPKTGRLHQIRAHFSAIGHPVAGDLKYGPKNRVLLETLNRHFLHAESLEIDIPQGAGNSKKMIFLAPLPKELKNLISI